MLIVLLAMGVIAATDGLIQFLTQLTYYDEGQVMRQLRGRDLYLRWVLAELNSEIYQALGQLPDFHRDFSLMCLRKLSADLRQLTLPGWRWRIGVGAFYVVYALTWCKAYLWAGENDLRGVIGLQLALMR